jgi:glycosyltransferase involved in cell wall biosynthesis
MNHNTISNGAPLKISVVICCYSMDRLKDVREAVASVLNQTLKPYEVIVVVDHTVAVFQHLQTDLPSSIKVVLNEGVHGLSETRNVGIRASDGDIIAFIDDDAVADPAWLEKLSAHYVDPRVIAVGGKASPVWESGQRARWFPEELDWTVGCTHKGPAAKSNQVRNMIGCNMSFRREAFNKSGLFNNQVGRVGQVQGMGEDTEICMRIKHSLPDQLILHESGAVIYHKVPIWRVTWKYLIRRSYNEGLFKNTVRALAAGLSSSTFAPENSYLGYLIFIAAPKRLLRFYRRGSLSQAFGIWLCIAFVGIGYIRGRLSTVKTINQNMVVVPESR